MKKGIKSVLAGVCAGAINGLCGAGGGMLLVPIFCRLIKLPEKRALATSVAVIACMSLVSATVYLIRGDVHILSALPFMLGGLAGGFAAGKLLGRISASLARRVFALLIIFSGIRGFFS